MASDVEILNVALAILGDDPISALTDDNERARLANRIYVPTRDAVLRSHPWNCATTRKQLALLAASPEFGWDYQFQLPNDCLRVLTLNGDEELADSGDVFKVEVLADSTGRVLMTNTSPAYIKYIKKVTDPALFDTLLYRVLSYTLAAEMAYAITGNAAVAERVEAKLEQILREARTIDGQEGSPDRQDATTLTDVR